VGVAAPEVLFARAPRFGASTSVLPFSPSLTGAGSNSCSVSMKVSMPQSSAARWMVSGGAKRINRFVRVLGEHPAFGQALDQCTRGDELGIEVDTDPEATATHRADEARIDGRQTRKQVRTQGCAARNQTFVLDDAQRLEANRGRERIAAEGGTVAAGLEQLHHFVRGDEAADRQQTTTECLAEDQPVGPDAFMLEREPAPRPTEA